MKNKYKKKEIYILIISIALLGFLILVEMNKQLIEDPWYHYKYEAAIRTEACISEIKKEKLARGMEIETEFDLNSTGIIGTEMNGITTTLGNLESKRTSANPNFAAVMVDMMISVGLKSGDNIAINFSSSFPALNIATIVACEVLELNPIIISSIGSSTWGGNNLEFTYLDMEEFLYQKGLIKNKSLAISPGGVKDMGMDMNAKDLEVIFDRMKTYGKKIILEENLEKNIDIRNNLYYESVERINCFINVGGNIVAFGNTTDLINTPPGLLRDMNYKVTNKTGLVQLFNSKGIPIIHLLSINELANRYGLEVDPDSVFIVGDGNIYYTYSYPNTLIEIVVLMTLGFLIILKKRTCI